MNKITGVIIARFQTPYLHEGHTELIEQVNTKHNKVIIILGVAPLLGSRRSPYDFHTREKMIKKAFPEVVVLPLADHPSDDSWSYNLDQLLAGNFPNEAFHLYGSRDSFISYYSGKFETVELPQKGQFNASTIREELADKVKDSEDFRAGILYAYYNTYSKVYPTVDVAVFKDNKQQMLLGRKANSPKWRLIGGFSDPEDENFELAARRELKEECGDIEVSPMQYETSMRIDDWRYRNEMDKIITTLFSCDLLYGSPVPNDDIVAVQWFAVEEIKSMVEKDEVTPEHHKLLSLLADKYNK
ncbi:MAG: NUDIX domain-containing protein [Bacteroidota bacterium]